MESVGLSPSALLTWKIANQQALFSQSELIEPVHIFQAILLMLDEILSLNSKDQEQYAPALLEVRQLRPQTMEYLKLNDEALTQNRRRLTQSLQVLNELTDEPALHRSETTRQVFRSAIGHQAERKNPWVTFLDLLKEINLTEMKGYLEKPRRERRITQTDNNQERNIATIAPTESIDSIHSATPILESLGIDLTSLARQGKLPPVIGREAQMTSIARILHRTSKRNVILTGDAGVGKTAVVEGFAQKITSEFALPELKDLRIIQINLGDLVAGTSFRGQMEERIQGLIKEVCSDPNLVLFLDEIHLLIGSGATDQSNMDLANLLKPALARDDFRCIGATTEDEYERYIKNDPAFKRRFQVVQVPEPSRDETLIICRGWVERIQSKQQTQIDPKAIESAVDLSITYLTDRSLPDKAIDLLENAAAYAKIGSLNFDEETSFEGVTCVTVQTIEKVLQEQYGIILRPLEILTPGAITVCLSADLVGQEEATVLIGKTLAALALRKKQVTDRPLGVLLFTGPTGTGKTYAARLLAKCLFPNQPDAFVRFSMNEYKEHYDLSRLTGAAPGLIGHEQAGVLYQFVQSHRQGVILLDEIEKAAPEIQDFFLQIFDEGEGRDSRGRLANFRQQLFVLTANICAESKENQIQVNAQTDTLLEQIFSPELLGRIDQVVEFRALDYGDYSVLFDRLFKKLIADCGFPQVNISVSESDYRSIVKCLSERPDGARGFLRRFEQQIALPVTEMIQSDPKPTEIFVQYAKGKIVVCA